MSVDQVTVHTLMSETGILFLTVLSSFDVEGCSKICITGTSHVLILIIFLILAEFIDCVTPHIVHFIFP